jgi:hypothetical protein
MGTVATSASATTLLMASHVEDAGSTPVRSAMDAHEEDLAFMHWLRATATAVLRLQSRHACGWQKVAIDRELTRRKAVEHVDLKSTAAGMARLFSNEGVKKDASE